MIDINYDNTSVLAALTQLQQATGDLSPVLLDIGAELAETTKQRFSSTTGPDGDAWPENSPVTLDRKSGSRPLTGETGVLGNNIEYQLVGNDTLEVGSPMEYAAMQQFGGTKSEFPWLWGDIPARPYLGLSSADEGEVLDILNEYLEDALN